MKDFTIEHFNNSFLRVYSSDYGLEQQLSEFFTFEFPNYQFTPQYKKGLWDGKIRNYNLQKKTLRTGLLNLMLEYLDENKISYEFKNFPEESEKISYEQAETFIESLNIHSNGKKVEVRDYQIESLVESVNNKRLLVKSATGSGKSLIIYCVARWYLEQEGKCLIVVPNTMLVEQSYNDMLDYSSENGFDVKSKAQMVFGGKSKDITKNIVISTWQSIYKLDSKFFNQFSCIIVDECHTAKGMSLQDMLDKSTQVSNRIGFTGTIDKKVVHKLSLIGMFGNVFEANSTQSLISRGMLVELKIKALLLKYDEETRKLLNKADYKQEIDFLISYPKRNNLIAKLATTTPGNTLILFRYVEKHGKVLYDMIRESTSRKVYYIHGGINQAEREQMRKEINTAKDAIIIGTDSIMSTGINIPALDNIIFANPTKSMYKVLQSIGRILRLKDGKTHATVFDIADDISYRKKKNVTLNHFIERLKIYNDEKFKFKITDIEL